MKKFRYIFALCAMLGFVACDNESIEDLSGEFGNIMFCNFTNATVQPTDKLGKGIKALNTTYTDAAGSCLTLRFGSSEWILGEGTYTVVQTVTGSRTYNGTINGAAISEGEVDVNLVGDTYFVTGLLTTADGKQYKTSYKGPLTFEVGVDDPEASGYTLTVVESAVSVFDWNTFTNTDYPDVTKYTFAISDPNGNAVAEINAIAAKGIVLNGLAGTYQVVSSAHDALTVDAGYSLPEYGMAGGTSYTDATGARQYVTGGIIEIAVARGADGEDLFTFTGSALETVDAVGTTATGGSFKLMYVSEKQ